MRHNIALYRLLGGLLLGLACLSQAQAQRMVSIDAGSAYMRAGPGKKHEIMWELSRHFPLRVLGRQGSWLKVRDFEGDIGWVFGKLTGRSPYMIVKAAHANIRGGPGTRYRILGRAEYGDLLKTHEKRGRWVRVAAPNKKVKSGWVARSLVWGW